jgi:glycosyltransferase involved in cell wall biosynthesis
MCVVSLMTGGALADAIRAEGVEVVELGQRKGRLSPRGFNRLVKVVKSFRPAFIQGHLFHSNILARIIVPFVPGSRALSTRHNQKDSPARVLAYTLTSPLGAGTIVFSRAVLDHARSDNLARRPIELLPYGIELGQIVASQSTTRRGLGLPEDIFIWIAVGRLTRQKGFDILLEAFARMKNRAEKGSILLIVGAGEENEALIRQASSSAAKSRIRFLGRRTDVPSLLAASDAFVLSSRWEGGPLVVLEAMAAGLPVVSTRVGDAPFMVQEGETGILVDQGDAGQLADAMDQVQGMGEDAERWGLKGRRRVEVLYDFRRTQKEMEIFYKKLAGDREPVQ